MDTTQKPLSPALQRLSPQTRTVLEQMGYHSLTPIQEESIPHLLGARDFIGQSQTGSGKTAAFALPILEKVETKNDDIQALILCPTRELCTQVAREMRQLARLQQQLRIAVLCGGVPVPPQILALQHGAHIIVGTPGRVLDHLRRGRLDFSRLKVLVLDEADRMLDMGFSEDMDEILEQTPRTRQTVFFSATVDEQLKAMSQHFQTNPVVITIESSQESRPQIEQSYLVPSDDKFKDLAHLLDLFENSQAIVFCNLKKTVQDLTDYLQNLDISCAGLSSDYEQIEREARLAMFKNGSLQFLIATDVAARGIDIVDLPLVINYDFPEDNETYVHRIGRTGRAGKMGQAISFIRAQDQARFDGIDELTQGKIKLFERSTFRKNKEPKQNWKTYFIQSGRKQKLRPGDLQGWLTGEKIQLAKEEIGKFEVFDDYSFFAVRADIPFEKQKQILVGQLKGRDMRVLEIDERTSLKSFAPQKNRNFKTKSPSKYQLRHRS